MVNRNIKPKAAILRTAGTNCDLETANAFRAAGAETEPVHVNAFIRKEKKLSDYQILAIPGGFSYGDDIAAGKILANELRFLMTEDILRFAQAGKPIIGICNGFQVLVKTGLLPEPQAPLRQSVTLTFNDSGHFEDRWVYLDVNKESNCIFTKGMGGVITLPVAHGEGKFFAGVDDLNSIGSSNQIVFKYTDSSGLESGYPFNPNGSLLNIAGICNKMGNVLGMMPHPERYVTKYNHPRWTREGRLPEKGAGLKLFENAVEYSRGM